MSAAGPGSDDIVVVKVGGSTLGEADSTAHDVVALARRGLRLVVVHGGGKTIVGNKCYLMAYCHLGHDVELEDEVLMANVCNLGGHSKIEYKAWLSAYSGTHQFVTVGRYAYAGAFTPLTHDVPPFLKVAGAYPAKIRGLNLTGLRSEERRVGKECSC